MWTTFFDMSSGGKRKTKYNLIAIEANSIAAIYIFKDLFEYIDPDGETCATCGSDFSISECEIFEDSYFYKEQNKFVYPKEQFTDSQKALVQALPVLKKQLL